MYEVNPDNGDQEPRFGKRSSGQLSWQQRMFVDFFLGESNGNATDAARRALYRVPGVSSTQLMKLPKIRAAIAAETAAAGLTAREVLSRLAEIATADLLEHVVVSGDGTISVWPNRNRSGTIKSITVGKNGTKIELWDKLAALEKLARYHRLFEGAPQEDAAKDLMAELETANRDFDRDIHAGLEEGGPAAQPGRSDPVQPGDPGTGQA